MANESNKAVEPQVEWQAEWQAPGPGSWEMDADHIQRPIFGVLQETFEQGFPAGMRATMAAHGMMLETFIVRFVNGFPYMQAKPVGAPAGGKPPPPFVMRIVMAVLPRVHPELRRRMKIASTLFLDRPWRKVAIEWQSRLKADTIRRHAEMDTVDVRALDDAALAEHVVRLRDYAVALLTQDHSMNLSVMLPIGDYLASTSSWTGLPHAELMRALRGTSDISRGEFAERMRLVDALRADASARATLLDETANARDTWQRMTTWPGEVGAAMRAFRLISGNAIALGLSATIPCVDEDPGTVLRALRRSVAVDPQVMRREAEDVERHAQAAADSIREKVPQQHRAAFDVILHDARLTNRLRDERHLYGAMPALGIARRLLLEVGRRAAARGALADASLALFARTSELCALADPVAHPCDLVALARELARRQHLHATLDSSLAPMFGDVEAPPDAEMMPNEGARRSMRALAAYMAPDAPAVKHAAAEDATRATQATHVTLQGLAVSKGVHEGIARLCNTAADLDKLRSGDILVASVTTPAINIVLPILGAIVTDRGGALSHAAIVTREYGIPGVVGTRDATKRIPDGARVRVDGERGVVTVLES